MKYTLKYEPKIDCFGWNGHTGKCNALNETVCTIERECSFYKKKRDFCKTCKK